MLSFVPCLILKREILISWLSWKLAKSALDVRPILLHSLSTVETPPTATSLQRPFFWWTVHTFTIVSTSLKRPPLYNGHFLCFYTLINSFMPALTIGIVRYCFYLTIFYSEKFSTWVWRLPFAVNVNLNLSIF